MKEQYYAYNNEAIASSVLLLFLQKTNSINMARLSVVIPFLLDDRTVNALLKSKDENCSLEMFIDDNKRVFATFNRRYLTLLPVFINALTVLNELQLIEVSQNSIKLKREISQFVDMGNRFDTIFQVIDRFFNLIKNIEDVELFKILNIQL